LNRENPQSVRRRKEKLPKKKEKKSELYFFLHISFFGPSFFLKFHSYPAPPKSFCAPSFRQKERTEKGRKRKESLRKEVYPEGYNSNRFFLFIVGHWKKQGNYRGVEVASELENRRRKGKKNRKSRVGC
jgi:hypothetical protein